MTDFIPDLIIMVTLARLFVCLFVCLFFSSSVYLGELEEVAIIFEVSIVRGTLLCS